MNQLNNCPICNTSAIGSFIKTTAQMHSKELFNFDQCAECKLVFLNPRVSLDVLQNYYTSHYRTGDQKRGVSLKISGKQPAKVRFKRVKRVKGVHVISPESLILDVGCNPSF
jgi:hypothetical protein